MGEDRLEERAEDRGGFTGRFAGGSFIRTLIQLAIASVIVGAIFSFLGLGPKEFWNGIFNGVKNLLSTIGESFGEIVLNLATYLVIGAAVVIPVWLIAKLWSGRKR